MLFRVKLYAIAALAFFAIAALFYGAVNAPFLRASEMNISGANRVGRELIINQLQQKKLSSMLNRFLGFNNILIWNEGEVGLNNSLIAAAMVARNWSERKVAIAVTEKKNFAIWCGDERICAFIDDQGYALERSPGGAGGLIAVINSPDTTPKIGARVLAEEEFMKLKSILDILETAKISTRYISYDHKKLELTAKTGDATEMYFSLRFDPAFTASALAGVKNKIALSRLEYIDLRIENKIFYKPR